MGSHAGSQFIRLASNLVLTRLLAPDMFGVMAIAWVLLTGLTMFSDLGISQNVIKHQRGAEPRFLATAWSVQGLRGAVIAVLVLSLAAFLHVAAANGWLPKASVYASPVLHQVILAVAFIPLLSGLDSMNVALAQRRLDFGPVARLEVASQLAGAACTVALAVATRSIWALVAGAWMAALARCVFSHAWLPGPRSRWGWDAETLSDILHFGKWIFLLSILGFLAASGDRLILGALVDPVTLGHYAIAFLLYGAVHMAMSRIVGSVVLPAFSEVVRQDASRLGAAFYRIRLPVDIASLLLAGFLFLFSPTIVHWLYDSRYAPAGIMLQVLSIALIALRFDVMGQCFIAQGRPKVVTLMTVFRILALYTAVPAVYALGGVDAALWAIAMSTFAGAPFGLLMMRRDGLLDMRRELLPLPAFPAGLLLGWLATQVAGSWR